MSGEEAPSELPATATVFWRYWTGSTISKVGSAVTTVALPLTAVLVVHASAFSVAAISAAGSVPWLLLGFPAGVYVSRLPLRSMQVAMDLVRAVAIGSVPVVAWLGGLSVAQLIAVALTVGSASVIFAVANATMLPAIVPKEELTRRNSLIVGSSGIAQLAGPGLGGVLVGVMGAASCMVLDAVSYLVSAVMLGVLPRPDSRPASKTPPNFRTHLLDGFAYMRTRSVLRTALWLGTISNLVAAGLIAIAPVFIVRTLREHDFVIGLIYASEGAGGLVGAALASRLTDAWGSARVVLRCALPLPLILLMLPFAFRGVGAILFGLGLFGFAVTLSFLGIALITHRQRTVPADMLPRVLAITQVVSRGGAPLGALVAGGLAAVFGVRTALFVLAALAVGVPFAAWANPEMRRRINLEED
jgi:MFS family permease